jgi:DNA invertase Pin-like site-specific DNA recombinase
MTPDKLAVARQLAHAGVSPTEIARTIGVGRATVYRHLQAPAS